MKAKREPVKAASSGNPSKHIEALVKKINDRYGYSAIVHANEAVNAYDLRRPSGVMQLDIDLGGGIPAGGVVKLTGPENSGKTHLMYMYLAMHQRIYGHKSAVAIGVTEWSPDYAQMTMAGMKVAMPAENIETKNMARIRAGLPPLSKEERAKLVEQIGVVKVVEGDSGEQLLANLLKLIDSNLFGIVCLDSLSMIMPKTEEVKDIEEDPFNVRARAVLLTNFHTRLHHALKRKKEGTVNKTSVILIDQVRANTDKANMSPFMQKFQKNWKESSPHAGKHGNMTTVAVWGGAKNKATSGKNKGKVLGKNMRWETLKGSKGTHDNITGEVYFSYDSGIDLQQSIILAGMQTGTIYEKSGALFVRNAAGQAILDDIKGGPEELASMMRKDFELERDIRQFILQSQPKPIECVYD